MGDRVSEMQRLGALVRQRREELRLPQSKMGGVSDLTVRKVEQGKGGPPRRSSMEAMEAALGWAPGTMDRILAGQIATSSQILYDPRRPEVGLGTAALAADKGLIETARALRVGRAVLELLDALGAGVSSSTEEGDRGR